MHKINPPFRADHVGSLLRPKKLLEARQKLEGDVHGEHEGSLAKNSLYELENECIKEVIAHQEEIGLRVITDGDFRRRSWFQDFMLELDGVSIQFLEGTFVDEKGHNLPTPTPHFNKKIRRLRGITTESFKFLRDHTTQTPKVTLPSPNMAHIFGGRKAICNTIYPDLDEFWEDLAVVYQEELSDLAKLGCTYVQIDDTAITMLLDEGVRARLKARGDDPDELLDTYIRSIILALKNRPANLVIATHLCRGNNRGHWLASGGYEVVAEKLFSQLKVDAYFLEYDSSRSGSFKPLSYMPDDKLVVLGLVSTKTSELEDKDYIKQRIDEASKCIPLDNLCISPQCGFASMFLGNPVTHEHQRKKLSLLVEIASDVWKES